MDGPHDLGGKRFFGPVKVDEPEEAFHSDWEARMWAIDHAIEPAPGWNLDWWRHVRELIDPVDYLTRPYFDQWMQIEAALLIDSGVATIDEIVSGRATTPGPKLQPPLGPEEVRAASKHLTRYDRADGPAPRFRTGDAVRANGVGAPGHTRLPAYVRGHTGTIERFCGAHVFPDAHARGVDRAESLYTVRFEAAELWPEAREAKATERRACVHLDLWESYLEPA